MLTSEQNNVIHRAQEISAQIDRLEQIIDELFTPLVTSIVQEGDVSKMTHLQDMLPHGFHRTELGILIRQIKDGMHTNVLEMSEQMPSTTPIGYELNRPSVYSAFKDLHERVRSGYGWSQVALTEDRFLKLVEGLKAAEEELATR